MSELHDLQQELRQLISRGKMEEAIRLLLEVSAQQPYSFVQNSISQKSALFEKTKMDKIRGLLNFEQELKVYNELSYSLLGIIDMLDKPPQADSGPISAQTSHLQNMQTVQGNDNTLISDIKNSQITIHQYFGPPSAPPPSPADPGNTDKT